MEEQTVERLAKLRKEHGYSQEQLADELGVTRQAVSKWERGEASPDTDNLIALAKLYGITVDEVLYERSAQSVGVSEQTSEQEAQPAAQDTSVEENAATDRENGSESLRVHGKYHGDVEGMVSGVTVMLALIIYFVLGGVWGLWHPAWIIFLAIPVVPTIPAAIRRKDMHIFCFPVLVVAVYLIMGCIWGLWHPGWVVFFLVPVYYIIADFINKK